MKRKISFVVLLIMLFTLILMPVAAYADEADADKAVALVDKANEKIEKEVMKAQRDAEKYIKVNQEYKIAERIEDLIEATNKISEKAIEKAAKYGADVICEFIEIIIGNTAVDIDPLRIVGV